MMGHPVGSVLIHYPPESADPPAVGGPGGAAASQHNMARIQWYCQWMQQRSRSVFVLLPLEVQAPPEQVAQEVSPASVIWYADEATLPRDRLDRGLLWLVNGAQMPLVDWTAARIAARRRNCDVLIFGQRAQRTHYPESVVVDADGRVIRFRRHYFDSPAFADRWSGQASFLAVSAEHAQSVINHLVIRGWGLDSVGALTLRFRVRWSSEACQLTSFMPETSAVAYLEGATRAATGDFGRSAGAPATDGFDETHRRVDAWPPLDPEDPSLASDDPGYQVVKRWIDASAALGGLILLSPLLLLVAIAVKLTSRGPVLFGHGRQGLGGYEFRCLKFRSMKVGSDHMQAALRSLNEVDGPQFKIKNDPRLTPIGGFLRKTNLDELPQLWNVLRGDMSLVGPRPSPDAENQLCPAWRRARLSVRPGITGLWQVLRLRQEARSDFQEWILYDMEYAQHCSLWLDFLILLYTPVAVFAPHKTRRLRTHLERHGICIGASAMIPDMIEHERHLDGEGGAD